MATKKFSPPGLAKAKRALSALKIGPLKEESSSKTPETPIDTKKKSSLLSQLALSAVKVSNVPSQALAFEETNNNNNELMDEINAEMDHLIKEDKHLKACLLQLVQHEWPFSWIKGQETFIDVIRKEISDVLAKKLDKPSASCSEEEGLCPVLSVTFGTKKIHLSQGKLKKDTQFTFKATLGGHNRKTYRDLNCIPFESKAKDVLQIQVYKDSVFFGVALVALADVLEGQFQKWTIKGFDDRVIGHLEIQLDFKDEGKPSEKDKAQKELIDYMVELLKNLYKGHLDTSEVNVTSNKVQYGVVVSEKKTCSEARSTKTVVSVVGSDRWSKSSCEEVLPDNGKEVFIPFDDLTSDKIEIKVLSKKNMRKTSKTRRPSLLNAGEELYQMVFNNNGEASGMGDEDDNLTQIQVSDIHFKDGLSIPWRGELTWHLRIAAKSKNMMGLKELSMFHFLTEFRRSEVDASALLNYLRPFFTPLQWKEAELNSKLKLFCSEKYSNTTEKEILKRITDFPQLPAQLDPKVLEHFKSFCLNEICNFDARRLLNVKGLSEVERLQSIITGLNVVYSFDNEVFKESLEPAMLTRLSEKMKLPAEEPLENKVELLCEKINDFAIPTLEIIQRKFSAFALTTWCPSMAGAIFKALCPQLKCLIEESFIVVPRASTLPIHENFYNLFRKLKQISKYNDSYSHQLHTTFEPCLSMWAQCAVEKANIQVERVLEMGKHDHSRNGKSKKLSVKKSISFQWSCEESDKESWKCGALNVFGILQSCHKTWEELQWPKLEESLKFGFQLFCLLRHVFKKYISGLHDIIMLDEKFDHVELVLSLNCLHDSVHYVGLFEKSVQSTLEFMSEEDISYEGGVLPSFFSVFAEAREDVNNEALLLIDKFCQKQRCIFITYLQKKKFCHNNEKLLKEEEHVYAQIPHFYDEEHDEEDTDHLLGYLNAVLKFLHLRMELETEKLTLEYKKLIKDQLFEILEEEMIKASDFKKNKVFLPQLYEAIEQTIDFRRNVSLKESNRLNMAKGKLWLKTAKTPELISRFLSELSFNDEAVRGNIKFTIDKKTDGQLDVTLQSIANLAPRHGKSSLDFSVTIALLPFTDSYKVRHATKIYPDATHHIFDLSDSKVIDESHKCSLALPCKEVNQDTIHFQVVVYDHSISRTNKIFRGMFMCPLNDLFESSEPISAEIRAFPKITEDMTSLWDKLAALRDRAAKHPNSIAAKFYRDTMSCMNESRKVDFQH